MVPTALRRGGTKLYCFATVDSNATEWSEKERQGFVLAPVQTPFCPALLLLQLPAPTAQGRGERRESLPRLEISNPVSYLTDIQSDSKDQKSSLTVHGFR